MTSEQQEADRRMNVITCGLAVMAFGAIITLGVLEDHKPKMQSKMAGAKSVVSTHQMMERRRARMAQATAGLSTTP
jgi:hypothetical protein